MEKIITSNEDLRQMVKDGFFFRFCMYFAFNKGFQDYFKEKKEVSFTVGDYDVKFDSENVIFLLTNRIYFARIITAYYDGAMYIGDDEEEVINELLTELDKEIKTTPL